MPDLATLVKEELPHINAAIESSLSGVPPICQPVAAHVLEAGGKRLRGLLTVATGHALGFQHKDLYTLGAAVEIIHSATLLHDDILDNAPLRRGSPAAHTIYGAPMVILAGDTMLAQALVTLVGIENHEITESLAQGVMRTIEGELAEFAGLRNTEMSQKDYENIIIGKTAWMFRASCEIGALRAGASKAQVKAAGIFGLELGIAFQMVDDALDFSSADNTGKPVGGDLREGKITPPLLMYINDLLPEKQSGFKKAFMEGTLKKDEEDAAIAAICSGGYAEKTRQMARAHLDAAYKAIEVFPQGPARDTLADVLEFIGQRAG